MDTPHNGHVIVGCTHGGEDADRVVVSYLVAGATLDQGNYVVLWLSSEGVRLAPRGYGDPIRAGSAYRSSACMTSSSRRVAASRSPICFNDRGLDAGELVE